jgi:hypothetical protein
MTKLTSQNDMLNGIESNIEATEKQIHRLQIEFASFLMNGATGEQRRLTIEKLSVLQDNLQLLKTRRMYALEETVH